VSDETDASESKAVEAKDESKPEPLKLDTVLHDRVKASRDKDRSITFDQQGQE
jgi:hypothetical protein